MSLLTLLTNATPRGGWQLSGALALPVKDDSRVQVGSGRLRARPRLGAGSGGSVHVRICVLGGLMVVHSYTVWAQVCVYTPLCSQTLRQKQRVLPALLKTCARRSGPPDDRETLSPATFWVCQLRQGRHCPSFGGGSGEGQRGSPAARLCQALSLRGSASTGSQPPHQFP